MGPARTASNPSDHLARLHQIEGQVRGVTRMVKLDELALALRRSLRR
ncbi:metal-sensing transcriptional repressor [Streptomyces decoyicus]|nr:metal-sensing transcriptional repressor [Streptomyces decoyicus]